MSFVVDVAGFAGTKWLAECSAEALGEALRAVAPELSGCPVTVPVPDPAAQADPLWWSSSLPVGERFIARFAWSRPAALRLAREIGVLSALAREPKVPFLPEVVASSTDPLLLVTRRVPGASLFDVIGSIDRDRAARQLAWFLAALHQPGARQRAEAVIGKLTGAQLPPATTGKHCASGSGRGPGRISAGPSCAGATGPTPCSPRPARPCSYTATCMATTRYGTTASSGWWWISRPPEPPSSEAGIPLADHRTPPEWVEDLAARFSAVGIDP
jgi:hypothetical protein